MLSAVLLDGTTTRHWTNVGETNTVLKWTGAPSLCFIPQASVALLRKLVPVMFTLMFAPAYVLAGVKLCTFGTRDTVTMRELENSCPLCVTEMEDTNADGSPTLVANLPNIGLSH